MLSKPSRTTDRVMSVEIVTRWPPDGSSGPWLNPRAYAADARQA
jgi:hypothetical protein